MMPGRGPVGRRGFLGAMLAAVVGMVWTPKTVAPGTITAEAAARLLAYWDAHFVGAGARIGKFRAVSECRGEDGECYESDEEIAVYFYMPKHPLPRFDNVEALSQKYYTEALERHVKAHRLG